MYLTTYVDIYSNRENINSQVIHGTISEPDDIKFYKKILMNTLEE